MSQNAKDMLSIEGLVDLDESEQREKNGGRRLPAAVLRLLHAHGRGPGGCLPPGTVVHYGGHSYVTTGACG